MSKFTFDKKEQKLLVVEIEGKRFSFNPYTLTVKKAQEKFVKCNEVLINRSKKKNLTQQEIERIVIDSCSLVKDTINSILGKGSYERIFKGRTIDFYEHQNLISFLFEEIITFCKENPNESTIR